MLISEAAGIASMLALRDQFELDGPDAPNLSIWSGDMPTAIEDDVDPLINGLLAEFELIGSVFGDPVREGNYLAADLLPMGGVTGLMEGQASFFRMYDRNGVTVLQGSVGLVQDGPDLAIDDIEITEQKLVTAQALRLILPLVGA